MYYVIGVYKEYAKNKNIIVLIYFVLFFLRKNLTTYTDAKLQNIPETDYIRKMFSEGGHTATPQNPPAVLASFALHSLPTNGYGPSTSAPLTRSWLRPCHRVATVFQLLMSGISITYIILIFKKCKKKEEEKKHYTDSKVSFWSISRQLDKQSKKCLLIVCILCALANEWWLCSDPGLYITVVGSTEESQIMFSGVVV